MSKFQKSTLTVDGNHVQMSMPFAKVDKENRLVSGYATLDNLDTQGDVVLAEASQKAFARARGNIREMHQPIAVGKIVDFREDEYFDAESGELYRGIYATAYVSKGAPDTWEKVLDGTLTGFSIGGEILDASNEFVKEAGQNVRFIKDYELTELSLVDNPANQLANVLSIQESANGSVTVKGMVAETVIENVFVCTRAHEAQGAVITVHDTETADCPLCGNKMENAGWMEETGADRAEKVKSIVSEFLSPAGKEAAPNSESEGGVEVAKAKSNESEVPEGKEVSSPNPEEAREAGDTEAVANVPAEAEKAADVDETEGTVTEEEPAVQPEEVEEDENTEISKKIDEMAEGLKSAVEASKEETLKKVSDLDDKITKVREEFLAEVAGLNEKFSGAAEEIKTHKAKLSAFEKMMAKMNGADAFKKSADLEPAEEVVQKSSFWGNAFSGQ